MDCRVQPLTKTADHHKLTKTLFLRYRHLIFELVSRGMPADDARDIVQEAFLRFLKYGKPQFVRSLKPYLIRIALNLAAERHKQSRQDVVISDSALVNDVVEQGSEETYCMPWEAIEAAYDVETIAKQLPRLHASILARTRLDGCSYEEAARRLNLSPHTIKKYLLRIMRRCRALTQSA